MSPNYTLAFSQIRMADVARVGGKNASLGELYSVFSKQEIGVLDGFAITTDAYWRLLEESGLRHNLENIFAVLNPDDIESLSSAGHAARTLILQTPLPAELSVAILDGYRALVQRLGTEPALAVRSSASAEDLPEASFAGAAESFLNVQGKDALLRAVHQCFASLFTDRAINYRARQGYSQLKVALSVGVMPMVRSDKACSGVMFTLDTESGFRDVVTLTGAYGLGEFVVQGVVTPDEWTIFKPTLKMGFNAIIGRQLGSKEVRLVYGDGTRTTRSEATQSKIAPAIALPTERPGSLPAGDASLKSTIRSSQDIRSPWTSNGPRTASLESSTSCRRGRRPSTPPEPASMLSRSIA